jgi:hypothetical protein
LLSKTSSLFSTDSMDGRTDLDLALYFQRAAVRFSALGR